MRTPGSARKEVVSVLYRSNVLYQKCRMRVPQRLEIGSRDPGSKVVR
jgi:hypothetical protein